MPEKGWKNVPLREEWYAPLERQAKKNHRPVARELEAILDDSGLKPDPRKEIEA